MKGEKDLLIVEDDPRWQKAIGRELTEGGFTFDSALSPEDAYTALEERRFNAVLVDMALRGPNVTDRSGLKVIRALSILADRSAVAVFSATTEGELASAIGLRQRVPLIEKGLGVEKLEPALTAMVDAGRRDRPIPRRPDLQASLRGDWKGDDWEVFWSRALPKMQAGAVGATGLLVTLLGRFWPAVPLVGRPSMKSSEDGIVLAVWSRRVGKPLVASLSTSAEFSFHDGMLREYFGLEHCAIGDAVSEKTSMNGYGRVAELLGPRRADFAQLVDLSLLDDTTEDWVVSYFRNDETGR